jgi:hypothetical protein
MRPTSSACRDGSVDALARWTGVGESPVRYQTSAEDSCHYPRADNCARDRNQRSGNDLHTRTGQHTQDHNDFSRRGQIPEKHTDQVAGSDAHELTVALALRWCPILPRLHKAFSPFSR